MSAHDSSLSLSFCLSDFCCILKMFGRHVVDVVSSSSCVGLTVTDPERAALGADLLRRIRFAACIRSRRCDSLASKSLG